MRIKIKDIGEDGLSVELPLTEAWFQAECPDLGAKPVAAGVKFRGRLDKSGDDVLLRGRLAGALDTSCSRCLEPAKVPLGLDLFVTFVPRSEGDADDEDDSDDSETVHFDGDEIDLGAELREEILLAMPINPLCREDCRGLCSVCGGNRNQVECDCEARQKLATGKLAALAKIKLQ